MKLNKLLENKYFNFILAFSILIGSLNWIIIPLPFTSKHFSFMLSEVIVFVLDICLIYKIVKKEYVINNKKIIYGICGLLLFLLIAIVYRTMKYGFDMEYLSYPRVSFCVISFFLLIDSKILKKNFLGVALIIFISVLNVSEFIYFLMNASLRLSTIAININIYSLLALLSIPYFISIILGKRSLPVYRLICAVNVMLTCFLIPYTGSRTSFFMMMIILLISFILQIKKLTKQGVLWIACGLVIIVGSTVFTYHNFSDSIAKASVLRATMIDKMLKIENDDLRFREENITPTEGNNTAGNTPTEGTNGEVTNPSEEPSKDLQRTSDIMRSDMWKKAMEEFKKEPLIGKGILTFDVTMSGKTYQQSPHNFIFELLLSYGIVGSILYVFCVLCLLYKYIIINKKIVFENILYVMILVCFSFFQPTMVSYLALFVCLYLIINKEQTVINVEDL